MKQNTLLYIIIALLAALLGYNYMQQNKQPIETVAENVSQKPPEKKANPAKDITQKVQQALRKVGYKVATDGVLEERTVGSIKDFEEKNGLIVTGKADSVMLEELQKAYIKLDEQAWQAALDTNTEEAYQNYQEQFADGKHLDEIAEKVATIQELLAQQQAQEEAKKQKQAQAAKRERERLAKEKKLAGTTHKDCEDCPTMVYIPSGSFQMGSNESDSEKPIHTVKVKQFYMGQTVVTFDQWYACYKDGDCSHYPEDEDWGRGSRPVINVNWNDAQQYIAWINRKTGKKYRLPSEAEWEYAAKAGGNSKYSTGNSISCRQARYSGCGSETTVSVRSYSANNYGLYDMHGNVWEWVEDCWNNSYKGAPVNGSAWQSGDCSKRVMRGGDWYSIASYLRSASRGTKTSSARGYNSGFRIAQDK